jgi:hypothetical protein
MQNVVGVLLACLGLFGVFAGLLGVRVGASVAGLALFVSASVLLVDVDGS